MAYRKNDTEKYNHHSRNVTEIIDDYFLERKTSKLATMSSVFSNVYSSLTTNASSFNNSKFNSSTISLSNKPVPVLSKIQEYTRDIKGKRKNERIEKLNKKQITNVNVMDMKYKDINSNNYFLSHLRKFKEVDDYNAKAQELFYQDIYPNKGCWKINVVDKIYLYRKQLQSNK